jgi:hypothetical protein
MATSSIRTSPTCHPAGLMMLYRISRETVNPACPAVNETAGAMPATRIATGSSTHSSTGFVPSMSTSAPPMMNPIVVPTSPRTTLCPVLRALERSTDSAPSTIQNEC